MAPKKNQPPFDLIAIGGITWDSIVSADEALVLEEAGNKYLAYPYGKKITMDQAYFGFGGGGSNVAVAASRLGLRTSVIGAVGPGHIGQTILEYFTVEGVAIKYLKRDREHRTGVSIVLTAPDGERSILLYRGANDHLTEADVNWPHCADTHWLYVSSLSGDSDKLYNEVAEMARAGHVKLAINPGETQIKRGPKGLHTALADCDVLLLNEQEARALLRQRGEAGDSVLEMLKALQAVNTGVVAITQGSDGAQVYDGTRHHQIDALTRDRVNTLGAGDAFGATFVTCLSKDLAVSEALRYASVNASAVVSDYGAQTALLVWDELTRRAKDAAEFKATVKKA